MPHVADALIYYMVFLLSTTLHEAAPAWTAHRRGRLHRLSRRPGVAQPGPPYPPRADRDGGPSPDLRPRLRLADRFRERPLRSALGPRASPARRGDVAGGPRGEPAAGPRLGRAAPPRRGDRPPLCAGPHQLRPPRRHHARRLARGRRLSSGRALLDDPAAGGVQPAPAAAAGRQRRGAPSAERGSRPQVPGGDLADAGRGAVRPVPGVARVGCPLQPGIPGRREPALPRRPLPVGRPARTPGTMTTYAAFLRAINVGGHVVKMDRLRRLVESLGHARVETLIASGNVIFES